MEEKVKMSKIGKSLNLMVAALLVMSSHNSDSRVLVEQV